MKDLKPLLMMALLCLFACKKETLQFSQLQLKDALERLANPLPSSPLNWQDKDLVFLDKVANAQIIGLGEASHGTKEFFQAKHRIFQYMVENHGVKIFAMEADFGESIFINEAIQEGRTEDLKELMAEKMHFWTWHTQEVLDMLEWMSEYNKGKSTADKIQYWGMDCQFNTFNPMLLDAYLKLNNDALHEELHPLLSSIDNFNFNDLDVVKKETISSLIEALAEAIRVYELKKADLVEASSEKEYELNLRLLVLSKQVMEVRGTDSDFNLRDQYMAENTRWISDYFNQEKVVYWAHNGHIANNPYYGNGGAMGHHLKNAMGAAYKILGFTFNEGTFTAGAHASSGRYLGVQVQSYRTAPKAGSLNEAFSAIEKEAFAIDLSRLCKNEDWDKFFRESPDVFSIGASFYEHSPEIHYLNFDKDYYDYLIHFEDTNASELLRR